MELYEGFSVRVVREDSDIYIIFPRIITFKRDEIFSILVDYKSNGFTAGLEEILSEKYEFTITYEATEHVAAVFYEKSVRHGEYELLKEEVYDVPYEVNTALETVVVPFDEEDCKNFRQCLQRGKSFFPYSGWRVYQCLSDGHRHYEIQEGQLQEIIDLHSSDEEISAFNIEGIMFRKDIDNGTEKENEEVFVDDMDLKEIVSDQGHDFGEKYILVADASYPALKMECNSILEAQIMLVKHREAEEDIPHGGNLFLGDEYVGWIDERGDFHDRKLPEGRYRRLHGVIHESSDSYPEYIEIDSVHYMRLSVMEYEIFCTQMDGNNRYESDYPDKDAVLYYSVEEQYIYPAKNILGQKWTELDKDMFDLFFVRENREVDFLFSEEILRIRAALVIQDNYMLDDERHVWILMDQSSENLVFSTMFHAFMYHKKLFQYDMYPIYQEKFTEADLMRIARIKSDIAEMENTKQKDGSYHIQVLQMDAVLELIRKAEEMGGKMSHDEIIVDEFQEIITLKRYVEEIKINSTFAAGVIYEDEKLL